MSMHGTRESKSFYFGRPSGMRISSEYTRDVGLTKQVVGTASFAGSTITIGAGGLSVFKVGDRIEVSGTQGGLNNGDRAVLGVTATTLTVDWPVKTEGPTSNIEIRSK